MAKYLTGYLILLFPVLQTLSCTADSQSLQQQLALASADPTHLLSIYASLIGLLFVLLLVFTGRGFWWSIIDSICAVGIISLVTSPLYWSITEQWKVSLAIGASGLLAIVATGALYWIYRCMPEKSPPFPEKNDESP